MSYELAHVTKRGAHVMRTLPDLASVQAEIEKLFARRLEAVAWETGDREHEVAAVFKMDGAWTWYSETEGMA